MNKEEKLSDQWQTPQWLFDELDKEFHFDIDLCATETNSKCNHYCKDYLQDLTGSIDSNCIGTLKEDLYFKIVKPCGFMNPPYSRPKPFIEKAWEDSKYMKIVCLIKCDPSTEWWAIFWEYGDNKCGECFEGDLGLAGTCRYCQGTEMARGPKPGCEVRFFPKRIKFEPSKGLDVCTCSGIKGNFYMDSIRSCQTCRMRIASGPAFPSALIIMDRRRYNA